MQKSKKFLSTTSNQLPAISGFTLIELLIVISIIGVLAALIMANFNAARERARDVRRKTDLDQIKKSLRMYYNNDSRYPWYDINRNIIGCGLVERPATCLWDGENSWQRGNMVYMKILPQDPNYDPGDGIRYFYLTASGSQDFCLWASLENASDGSIGQSQARCSVACSGAGFTPATDYTVCAD